MPPPYLAPLSALPLAYSHMGALRKHDLGRLATFLAGLSQFLSQRPGHGQFLISRPEMNRENTGRSARYPSRSTRLLAPRLSLHADPRGTCRALLVAPRQPPCPLRSGFCGRSRLKRPARKVYWRAAQCVTAYSLWKRMPYGHFLIRERRIAWPFS